MTQEDFKQLCNLHPYYQGRWGYYAAAIEILRRERRTDSDGHDVLEIGPAMIPLVAGCQVMQRPVVSKHVESNSPTYLWDAGQTPWPIGTKRFAAAAALQVWEHLQGRQKEAFAELRRVSRFAILSVPYRWHCPADPVHHNITDETIAGWTQNHPMRDRIVVPDDLAPKTLRLVCSFAFD